MENKYEDLVKKSIENARYGEFRKVHISKVLKRLYAKHPEFIKMLYLELFSDDKGKVVNSKYRCALMRLCKCMDEKYNIRVWGHWAAFGGYVLDLVDIRTALPIVLADEFLGL